MRRELYFQELSRSGLSELEPMVLFRVDQAGCSCCSMLDVTALFQLYEL
jgi:hypothetical protein